MDGCISGAVGDGGAPSRPRLPARSRRAVRAPPSPHLEAREVRVLTKHAADIVHEGLLELLARGPEHWAPQRLVAGHRAVRASAARPPVTAGGAPPAAGGCRSPCCHCWRRASPRPATADAAAAPACDARAEPAQTPARASQQRCREHAMHSGDRESERACSTARPAPSSVHAGTHCSPRQGQAPAPSGIPARGPAHERGTGERMRPPDGCGRPRWLRLCAHGPMPPIRHPPPSTSRTAPALHTHDAPVQAARCRRCSRLPRL